MPHHAVPSRSSLAPMFFFGALGIHGAKCNGRRDNGDEEKERHGNGLGVEVGQFGEPVLADGATKVGANASSPALVLLVAMAVSFGDGAAACASSSMKSSSASTSRKLSLDVTRLTAFRAARMTDGLVFCASGAR